MKEEKREKERFCFGAAFSQFPLKNMSDEPHAKIQKIYVPVQRVMEKYIRGKLDQHKGSTNYGLVVLISIKFSQLVLLFDAFIITA